MKLLGQSYCFTIPEMLRNIGEKNLKFSKSKIEKRKMSAFIALDYMKVVLDDVINNGVQFKFMGATDITIQMDPVIGDDFKRARLNGKFYEIDPLKSDFTGYELNLVYKGKRRILKNPITVDYGLKDIMISKAYEKYKLRGYRTIADYSSKVSELYPEVPIEDIRIILRSFEANFTKLVLSGVSIYINPRSLSRAGKYMFLYNGIRTYNSLKALEFKKKQMVKKIRLKFKMLKREWNGYYYFALTDRLLAKILSQRKSSLKSVFIFDNIILYKLFEECLVTSHHNRKHIFRIPYFIEFGWTSWKKNYKCSDFEYIYRNEKDGLVQMTNITSRCDNMLFRGSTNFLYLNWLDRNLMNK